MVGAVRAAVGLNRLVTTPTGRESFGVGGHDEDAPIVDGFAELAGPHGRIDLGAGFAAPLVVTATF